MSRLPKPPKRQPNAPPCKSTSIAPNALGAKVKPPSPIVRGNANSSSTPGPSGSWGRLPR